MASRPARWIPIVSALGDFAVVVALLIFWQPPAYTLWWFVRGVPVMVFFYMGCMSVWHAFVFSDTRLRRRLRGDYTD